MSELPEEFELYRDQAMLLASTRSKPLSAIRNDFENLLIAVIIHSRLKVLSELKGKVLIIDPENNPLAPEERA